ncbi:MAG TPA: flagellin, partial [Limnobacter sp.]|nr:flagellin [Limnobacter sp.]
ASLFAQNNLAKTGKSLGTAIARLSSGLRVNSAKDDAAGLAISEKFRAQIGGMEVAKRNANDGISALEVAEGALGSITDSLQRMRELAVQASTGTLTLEDRAQLTEEYNALKDNVNKIVTSTNFNNIDLLTTAASGTDLNIQIGTKSTDSLVIGLADTQGSALTAFTSAATPDAASIANAADAREAIDALDTFIKDVSSQRSVIGAGINRLESVIGNLDTSITSLSSARGRIIDADFAKETAALTRAQILQQAGTSVLAQANQLPSSVLSLLG